MTIKIKFASGKEIELTPEEYAELVIREKEKVVFVPYDNTPRYVPFVQPEQPFIYEQPVITCATAQGKK